MFLPATISQVITQLEQIVRVRKDKRPRGLLRALYLRVTKEISNKINANYFEDNARMERLDVAFANRHITAYNRY